MKYKEAYYNLNEFERSSILSMYLPEAEATGRAKRNALDKERNLNRCEYLWQ